MERRLFSMYCSLGAIGGRHEEKELAISLLSRLKGKPGIVLLALEDPDWVYGQATFPLEEGGPFKFMDRFSTIASNGVLYSLVAAGSPAAILFVDAALKAQFERHQAFARLVPLFRQVPAFKPEPSGTGFFSGIKKFFTGTAVAPPKEDEATVCRNGVKVFSDRLRTEATLEEMVLLLVGLYHYCSLDVAQEVLEARVKANPNDAVANAGLLLLLSDCGEHVAALERSRHATSLPKALPEAHLWHAKEAWWASETSEGLQAIAHIEIPPANWPPVMRRDLEAMRAALLAQDGQDAAAAAALERAIDIDGGSYVLHLCLACVLADANRIDEALSALDNASVISPSNPLIQLEQCRLLKLKGNPEAFQRAFQKLCTTERGSLEARRFGDSHGVEGLKTPIPDKFEKIDSMRRRAIFSGTLPTWLDLCDGSPVKTFFNVLLQDAHRGEEEIARGLSKALRALDADPLDATAQVGLAACWMLAKRPVPARAWSQSAVALAPDVETHHWLLTEALKLSKEDDAAFDAAMLAVDLDKANDDVKKTLSVLLWSIPRLDAMAGWIGIKEAREQMRRTAEELLNVPQRRAGALMAKSLLAFYDNDLGEAMELQRKALLLEPDRDAYHEFHVQTLAKAGRSEAYGLAVEARASALRRRETSYGVDTFTQFAELLLDLDRPEQALTYVRAGLQLSPDAGPLLVFNARVLQALGRVDEALGQLKELAFSDSSSAAKAAQLLGDGLSDAGKREESLCAWQRLQDLEPDNATGFLGAGVELWLLDRNSEAADVVARAVSLDESHPYAWGLLGRILKVLGRNDQALVALRRAVGFEHPPKYAISSLAALLLAMGKVSEAREACETALAKDHGSAEAAAGRVEALAAAGMPDVALQFGKTWVEEEQAEPSQLMEVRSAVEKHVGYEAALSVGAIALEKYPEAVELLVDQAWGLATLGRFSASASLARRAVALEPEGSSPLAALCHACVHTGELSGSEAQLLADRLMKADQSAYASRLASDLLRSGGVDAQRAYEAALKVMASDEEPNDYGVAWCLLHLGRLSEAQEKMNAYVAKNPEVGAATIDRAIIGFLASGGSKAWEDEIASAVRATSHLEYSVGLLAELHALVPQWKRQALVSPGLLTAMSNAFERGTREAARH